MPTPGTGLVINRRREDERFGECGYDLRPITMAEAQQEAQRQIAWNNEHRWSPVLAKCDAFRRAYREEAQAAIDDCHRG